MKTYDSKLVLSERELQITSLVCKGFTSKEIGEQLNLSLHTVETHRKNILKKLNLKKTTALVDYYNNYIQAELLKNFLSA
jgi:DNA-binding NarL/FixJ family response regulator